MEILLIVAELRACIFTLLVAVLMNGVWLIEWMKKTDWWFRVSSSTGNGSLVNLITDSQIAMMQHETYSIYILLWTVINSTRRRALTTPLKIEASNCEIFIFFVAVNFRKPIERSGTMRGMDRTTILCMTTNIVCARFNGYISPHDVVYLTMLASFLLTSRGNSREGIWNIEITIIEI